MALNEREDGTGVAGSNSFYFDSWRQDLMDPEGEMIRENVLIIRGWDQYNRVYHVPILGEESEQSIMDAKEMIKGFLQERAKDD